MCAYDSRRRGEVRRERSVTNEVKCNSPGCVRVGHPHSGASGSSDRISHGFKFAGGAKSCVLDQTARVAPCSLVERTKRGPLERRALWIASPSASRSVARGDRASPIAAAAATLGADTTSSLRFAGDGVSFTVGQNFTADDPWPRVAVRRYDALIDYRAGAMRVEMLREMGARMPRGGGV